MKKEQKVKAIEELKSKFEKYSLVGLVDLSKMPTKQLQEIKKNIRGVGELLVYKKSIIERAIDAVKKENFGEIKSLIPRQPALIVSNDPPFKFYLKISKMRSPVYAKEGDVSEEDIIVSAGPTGLMPGPVISEFAKVGIPAGVEEGKIAIKKDKLVAKKGDVISKDLSSILRKLKIQPIKIGLNILLLHQNGLIYRKNVLDLAGEAYVKKFLEAHQQALNLSVSIGYPTKENIKLLLAKAYQHAKAIESKIGGK